MADDDPYNFTIDIPGKKPSVASRQPSKYDDSDDGNSDDGSEFVDDDSVSPPKANAKARSMPAKAAPVAKSNALDKAKNFLSKYSKPIGKPERRRVSLEDSDDDDASMDLSEDDKHKTSQPAKVANRGGLRDEPLVAPSRSKVTLDDISMDESQDEPPPVKREDPPKKVVQVAPIKPLDSSGSSVGDPPPFDNSSDDDDEVETSTTRETPTTTPAQVSSTAAYRSAPTVQDESDVYDDDIEEMEEESVVEDDAPNAPAVTTVVVSPSPVNEPAYDYSMEFSQDNEVQQPPPKEPSEDNYGDESFAASETPVAPPDEAVAYADESFQAASSSEEAEVPATAETYVEVAHNETPPSPPTVTLPALTSPPTPLVPVPVAAANIVDSKTLVPSATETRDEASHIPVVKPPRPCVTIVREYEFPARPKPEMRDASTQFTGNHVQIQADLGPQANVSAPAPEEPLPTPAPGVPEALPAALPPPLAQHAPQPMISASFMGSSVYRQQLQQIQLHIRRKRLETDRVLRETSPYRYTSYDETEKYVNLNRPRKLALWEALMKVDPSMSQETAMKIEALSKTA
ncbi:hypothetical protein ACHHYP_03013 [Achlya hypogyna]|uniref:Uncharacterized protein n=1 Tax=Achlya hypogyna TaxID=1202772 RepID=A0A1V9Z4W5_ACHHY|nr:hypothetical protein ACHHYP_03013 [Achlya hypogyna]